MALLSSFAGNLLGMRDFAFFGGVASYVDTAKQPGFSTVPRATFVGWLAASPFVLLTTPNGVWCIIALLMYFLAPYDLGPTSAAARAPLSAAFFAERLPLWLAVVLGYVAFFHISIYVLAFAKRPFVKDRPYNADKVAHNVFWTTVGVVVFVGFENVFAYLWATRRLPFVSDELSFSTTWGRLRFAAALMGVPVFRDFHFYFAHRLLHFGPLFQQAHSLHHRNTDIEPFAGLAMHPVEHLYYYACVVPSLVFLFSPFAFLWNGVHLVLSPAAGHSGWEDHFQADVFHYIHHSYFECNYAGVGAAFMDNLFGTFVASFEEREKDKALTGIGLRTDAKSTLRAVPTAEFCTFMAGSGLCVFAWARAALAIAAGASAPPAPREALVLAALVGFGPVLLAQLMSILFYAPREARPSAMGAFGNLFHLGFGSLFCSVPVAWMAWLALQAAPATAA